MRLVADIEANNLLNDVTVIWCICAVDIDTNKMYSFSDQDDDLPSIEDGIDFLLQADLIAGHNWISYDAAVIKKLYNVDLSTVRTHDTLILSKVLNYQRFDGKHNMKVWGEYLGNEKIEFNDFSKYSKEMLHYCEQDVRVNANMYLKLMREYNSLTSRKPMLKKGIWVEHKMQWINNQMREEGWNFDYAKALETLKRMQDRSKEIEDVIHPMLGKRKVYIDIKPRVPKFKKDGTYNHHTCRWLSEFLGVEVKPQDTHLWPAGKEFQRFKMEQIKLGQTERVKHWLYTIGWKPDDYVRVRTPFGWETKGPKLTSTSLEKLGEHGKMVDEYYTIRNRIGVIETWIENYEKSEDKRLHGDMVVIGTPSFRARHSGIVNIPSIYAEWGKEMRELFLADEGDILIGADSSGNQLRGLCHYVNNDDYTDIVINGDQHQRNADILGCTRNQAKTFLYSFMFGAGDAKLGEAITGKPNAEAGSKARKKFSKAVVGIEELKQNIESAWTRRKNQQGKGWIFGLDGRPVFAPADYQCLNYLLQCAEGVTCKAAVVWFMEEAKKLGLKVKPRIMMHDEMQISCHPDDVDVASKLAAKAFAEGPKWFGVTCMDGEADVGANYAETH